VGVRLETCTNWENGFSDTTDNDRLSEIVMQIHAYNMLNIGREKILQFQVFHVGVGLRACANWENGFCEPTDNDTLSGIVMQIHANYMLNIGREKILK